MVSAQEDDFLVGGVVTACLGLKRSTPSGRRLRKSRALSGALVGPGVEVVRKRQAAGQYPARDIIDFGDTMTPSPDELLAQTAALDPSVLFTLSHGEGAPGGGWRTLEDQRRRQGSMSFGREGKLTGEDLRSRPFMPGGVWFMLVRASPDGPARAGPR